MKDPVEDIEHPTLAEQVKPYRKFGDAELAVTLLSFEKSFGGPGIHAPSMEEADYHCPNCEENVRGVSLSVDSVLACPMCGEEPGILTLGEGPK